MVNYIDNPTPPVREAMHVLLQHGAEFPFDASDAWWHAEAGTVPTPKADNWRIAAARAILSSLRDRRGIKQELQIGLIDEDVREEIVLTIAAIIKAAPEWFAGLAPTPE